GQVLLYVKVNRMVVRLDSKNIGGKLGLSAGFFPFYIYYCYFHGSFYFSVSLCEVGMTLLLNNHVSIFMTGNRSFDHQKILFGNHFQDSQVLNRHLFTAHSPGHAHSLKNTSRIRRGTNGTRSAQTVVLTVGGLPNPAKTVTLHNPLETFSFGSRSEE